MRFPRSSRRNRPSMSRVVERFRLSRRGRNGKSGGLARPTTPAQDSVASAIILPSNDRFNSNASFNSCPSRSRPASPDMRRHPRARGASHAVARRKSASSRSAARRSDFCRCDRQYLHRRGDDRIARFTLDPRQSGVTSTREIRRPLPPSFRRPSWIGGSPVSKSLMRREPSGPSRVAPRHFSEDSHA
jgi:hypothetical protein